MKKVSCILYIIVCLCSIEAYATIDRGCATASAGGIYVQPSKGTIGVTGTNSCNWTLTALPADGYAFHEWVDGVTTKSRAITILDGINDIVYSSYAAKFVPAAFIDEWTSNKSMVLTTKSLNLGDATTIKIIVNSSELGSLSPTLSSKETGSWNFSLSSSLNTYAGQTLRFEFYNSSSKLIAATDTIVPYIVAGDETLSANKASVQVISGTLTIANTCTEIGILDIYPGAKVSQSYALTVDKIYMRADGPNKKYPQFYSAAAVTNNNGNIIYYDYKLNYSHYYPLALPYTVKCNKILTKAGTTPSYEVRAYNSSARASNNTGWTVLDDADEDAEISALKGYNIYAVPAKWGCARTSRPTTVTLRFPMVADLSSAYGDRKNKSVPVSKYASSYGELKNWNFICSPYLSNYTHVDDNKLALGYYDYENDQYVKKGEDQRYLTWSDYYFTGYTPGLVASTPIRAFFPYFVQLADIAGEGPYSLDFSQGAFSAPQRDWMDGEETDKTEYLLGLTLSNDNIADHTGLLYSAKFSQNYEPNADLVKIFGEQQPMTLYSLGADNEPRAFNALPVSDAFDIPVPLGYRNAPLGTMQIAFDTAQYDMSAFEAVWLTDHVMNTTVNLLDGAYTFTNTQEASDTRFAVTAAIRLTPAVTTGVEPAANIGGSSAAVYYDMLGRRVNAASAQQGVYVVIDNGTCRKEVIR